MPKPPRSRPSRFGSLFLSYADQDRSFADHLHCALTRAGVPCWFAPASLHNGDKLREAVDIAIRSHGRFLVVLSAHSINSRWVEKEVLTAFEVEQEREADIIIAVRIDQVVMDAGNGWAADIRRGRHMSDFSGWRDATAFQAAVKRLLHDLELGGNAHRPVTAPGMAGITA